MVAGVTKKRRVRRRGEHTCDCRAYKFPHRFGGGRCEGYHLAQEHWDKYWGHDSTCRNCNNFDDNAHSCEVLNGGESIRTCEIVLEYIAVNEIR